MRMNGIKPLAPILPKKQSADPLLSSYTSVMKAYTALPNPELQARAQLRGGAISPLKTNKKKTKPAARKTQDPLQQSYY